MMKVRIFSSMYSLSRVFFIIKKNFGKKLKFVEVIRRKEVFVDLVIN